MTPGEMLGRIVAAWRDWLLAIEGLPEDRVDEPGVCGHWSVKDLVPHMALWDLQAVEDIDRHLSDLPARRNDRQRMNDDTWGHYPEHTAQVRAWRAASGLG